MEIQEGNKRAGYGEALLNQLAIQLTSEFGRGFSERNLRNMRQFYQMFQNWQTVSSDLSWSHYLEIIKIVDEAKRNFHMKDSINSLRYWANANVC